MEKSISALVASHNEETTIGSVLQTLLDTGIFEKIVVVDDGTDGAKDIVRKLAAKHPEVCLIAQRGRRGKGNAVRRGLQEITSRFTFLCDADLYGLQPAHVLSIVQPVLNGEADMCVGLRDKNIVLSRTLMNVVLPLIGGERALETATLKKALVHPLADYYGMEPVMNHYYRKQGLKIRKVFMNDVNDLIKPRKWSFSYGVRDLTRETAEVALTYAMLHVARDRYHKPAKKIIDFLYR